MKTRMKYLFGILILLIASFQVNGQNYVVDGYVIVEDLFLPVNDQIVEIKSQTGNVLGTIITDESGYFSKTIIPPQDDDFIILEMVRNCSGNVVMYQQQLPLDNPHLEYIFRVCEDKPCVALFNYEQQSTNSLVFKFTDISKTDADEWLWDFGDGETSTQQNPLHVFSDQGNYLVTLTVENENCNDDIQRNVQVSYKNPLPRFSFKQVNQGEQPAINFTNNSIGYFTFIIWDFGDGSPFSNEINPKHAYNEPGDYNVSLTLVSQFNYNTLTKKVQVKPTPGCFALFSDEQIISSDLAIKFQDLSAGKAILFWYWEFGDGQNSEEQHPEHVYDTPGFYQVSLRVISTTGQDSYTRTIEVKESNGCLADFDWVQPDPDNPQVVFNSLTANEDLLFNWDFGDGSTSTLKSPAHQFDDFGTYEVSLEVQGYGCSDHFTQTIVLEEPIYCDAKFTWIQTYPQNRTISFASQSFGNNIAYLWKFGDGETSEEAAPEHTYPSQGSYWVKLLISTSDGCSDSAQATIEILPPLNFTGYVYAGDNAISMGSVYLYRFTNAENAILIGRRQLSDGFYKFDELTPGNYFVQAIPEFEFPYPVIPFYYPVYSGGFTRWQDADIIHTSSLPLDINIDLAAYNNFFDGKATLGGTIVQTEKADNKPLIIYLENNEGEIFRFTMPDTDQRFTFGDIPFGNYILRPEKAGKVCESFEVELSETNPDVHDVVFLETSLTIKPDLSGMNDTPEKKTAFRLYPNPANNYIVISTPEKLQEELWLKIYNPVTLQIRFSAKVSPSQQIELPDLSDGIYMAEISTGKTKIYKKLVIRN